MERKLLILTDLPKLPKQTSPHTPLPITGSTPTIIRPLLNRALDEISRPVRDPGPDGEHVFGIAGRVAREEGCF